MSGVIVGEVQSGKTAIMIGLAARALDSGFSVVLVLGGLRDDLRTQTAQRFTRDLLERGDEVYPRIGEPRFTDPRGAGYHGPMGNTVWAPHFAEDVNHDEAFASTLAKRVSRGKGVLAVAKKNLATINVLRDAIAYASRRCGTKPMPILVIDDECDEASVALSNEAPTPERMVEIWRDLHQYVVYLGMTATPAANLLQNVNSELYPKDFVEIARVPAADDSASTYLETAPSSRYTGGNAFYRLLGDHERANFLLRTEMSLAEFEGRPGHDAELEEALIAFFVSGAVRLCAQSGTSLSNSASLPAAHTMLAHTDLSMLGHWDLCRRVVAAITRNAGQEAVPANIRRVAPVERIPSDALCVWLENAEPRWKSWYEEFSESQRLLLEIMPESNRPRFPIWEDVKELLPEVFQYTQLRVINSDDASSDEPLQFGQTFGSGGASRPGDIYSIVIGGNRLSRGLTIEGLCISYYTRTSAIFTEDAAVQRERWLGYRGRHLEFCRVFTHKDLAIRFARFHEHDEDLRRQLVLNLRSGRSPVDSTLRFLRLRDSVPTAKLGRGSEGVIDLSGVRLFYDKVQMGDSDPEKLAAKHNEKTALQTSDRLVDDGEVIRDTRGRPTGYFCPARAVEIADFLEGFSYTFHNPERGNGHRYNLREFYREPVPFLPRTMDALPPANDPLLLAAYLRFWVAAYQRCEADGRENDYRAHDGTTEWLPVPAPDFNLVVRVGSLDPGPESGFRHPLLNRAVSSRGDMGSQWGGRGYGSLGDEWIDMKPPGGDRLSCRPSGSPGLALLHVVSRSARGRAGEGLPHEYDRPAVGLVVPEGGPSIHFVLADAPVG